MYYFIFSICIHLHLCSTGGTTFKNTNNLIGRLLVFFVFNNLRLRYFTARLIHFCNLNPFNSVLLNKKKAVHFCTAFL